MTLTRLRCRVHLHVTGFLLTLFSIQFAAGGTIYYNQIALPGGSMFLRRMNAEGTGSQSVPVALPSVAFPTLSRDGRRLLVTSPDPVRPFMISRNVFVLDLLTGTIGKVTVFEDICRNNQTVLTNNVGDPTRSEIHAVNLDSSNPRRIVSAPASHPA